MSGLFWLTDARGAPLLEAAGGQARSYVASKPTLAACKAFYVFMRSEAGKQALAQHLAQVRADASSDEEDSSSASAEQVLRGLEAEWQERGAAPPQALPAYLQYLQGVQQRFALPVERALASHFLTGAVTLEEVQAYRAARAAVPPSLFRFTYPVHLCRDCGGTVRRYLVSYAPVRCPNAHEIRKRIVKLAHAKYVPKAQW